MLINICLEIKSMPPIPPRPVQLTCPACKTPFRTNLYTVVDVGQQPELKQALLAGQLNTAVCPNCGTASMLGTPLVYHDPEKQLCLVYFPQELNARPEEQERFIGDTTSFLMRSLPPDAPRTHLLTPRRFMSLASLIDVVLEAEGIPREALEQQRRRIDLISQFAAALEDENQLQSLVNQYKGELDYEFFATLNAFIEASAQEQRTDSVELLTRLRDELLELSGFNPEADEADEDIDVAQAIERLEQASDAELDEVIAELRPAIDYSFFEAWTNRIEVLEQAGDTAAAQRLTARRTYILEAVERMDQEARALFEAGADVLREVLLAADPRPVLEAHSDKLGEAFMLVLSANVAAAQRSRQHELVERLEAIGQLAVEIMQERLSPEERFINELLMAETPQESTKLLRKNAAKVTSELVKQLNTLADDHEKRGMKPSSERLRQLAREAGAMLF